MELIITEKPSSMRKIAQALADKKAVSNKKNGVEYFTLEHNGNEITIVSAVGHLYTVAEHKQPGKKGWTYPIFDIEWIPSSESNKQSAFTKKYLNTIKTLAKKAKIVTVATDYDVEGEVIGYNILRYACKKEDGNRMKYSTVTVDELKQSYAEKMNHIDWGQAHAGVTRHELDWYYGINLSRALTLSVKAAGGFKILSSGRVQTPALKILADKEKEIAAFEPQPYWEVEITAKNILAKHKKQPFTQEEEAKQAQQDTGKTALVADIETKEFIQPPPHPFDLTTLQTESYKSFGMSPKETLSRAQDLYSAGYISYPRTSSQQLPESIGYQKILTQIAKQKEYAELANQLLRNTSLKPNNGKKSDPAHPAIYPTGIPPKTTQERAKKVYDIIVRRFLATFAQAAKRETQTIHLQSNKQEYHTKGTRTIFPGWHVFYGPHLKQKDEELPLLKQGEELPISACELLAKQTQPPRRYTPSSIIKELEKRGLGTKATRADIVDNLFERGYVHENSIQVTEIGLHTIDTLEKYVPEILDTQLTKEIEEEMEGIRANTTTPQKVLEKAKTHLNDVLGKFKKHEKEIGGELLGAQRETQNTQTLVGISPKKEEGLLQIKRSKFGFFVGSVNYPECKAVYGLPKGAYNEPAHKECPWCAYPLISTKRKGKGKQLHCFNTECPSRALSPKGQQRVAEVEGKEIPSPDEKGTLVVRRGSYGTFIASSAYPKSRYTENLETVWDTQKERLAEAKDLDAQELLKLKEELDKKKE